MGNRIYPPYYLTAYGLAVQQGFKGTLDEWLDSLIGPPGPPGKSAYEYAVAGGYAGSETEFAAQMARELLVIQVTEAMKAHLENEDNPHNVSPEGIGAAKSVHGHKAADIEDVIPITGGGTSAKTAEEARKNLDAAQSQHTHKAADIEDVIPIAGGGTGEKNGADGLAALFAAGYWRVSEKQIIDSVDAIPEDAPDWSVFLIPMEG